MMNSEPSNTFVNYILNLVQQCEWEGHMGETEIVSPDFLFITLGGVLIYFKQTSAETMKILSQGFPIKDATSELEFVARMSLLELLLKRNFNLDDRFWAVMDAGESGKLMVLTATLEFAHLTLEKFKDTVEYIALEPPVFLEQISGKKS